MQRAKYIIAAFVLCSSIGLALADAPKIPEGVTPLTEAEIKELLDGRTYEFIAYDEPLTGTTTWNYDAGTVSGSYIWDKKNKGTYSAKWFLRGDKNCTQSKSKKAVCQIVYPYDNGFMEVTAKGVVHAISRPIE